MRFNLGQYLENYFSEKRKYPPENFQFEVFDFG